MKKALLVAVNKYKDLGITDLRGCVNDAENMKAFLIEHREFETPNIMILRDLDATKANIIDGCKWLSEDLSKE